MLEEDLQSRIRLALDPYYDREFFTSLIYCMDRHLNPRQIFEAATHEVAAWSQNGVAFNAEMDSSLHHLYAGFQTGSNMRASYAALPLFQGLYSLALFRSEGREPLPEYHYVPDEPSGTNVNDFARIIRRESRRVESKSVAWKNLLFLLENRSTRAGAIAALIQQGLLNDNPLSVCLLLRAIDVAFACGWKDNETILRRPFDLFWESGKNTEPSEVVLRGYRLVKAESFELNFSPKKAWDESWTEEFWRKATTETPESVWEWTGQLFKEGATYDQIMSLLILLRGRCLYTMKEEQWSIVSQSILYADALASAARWIPQEKINFLAVSICNFVTVAQLTADEITERPSGEEILEEATQNVSKERLVFRLDDTSERGDREEALEVLAAILSQIGLSHSVSDRLLLMASKQDGWTYDQVTIPITLIVTNAYQASLRTQIKGFVGADALFGLLRFLSDQRQTSIAEYKETGTYGDGVSRSQYDVSEGARIIDRYVYNQLRNAQRIQVWPTDD